MMRRDPCSIQTTMPLRAVSDIGVFQAFEYDEARWAELRGSYKALGLHMPCCESMAIPKTSALGNFFFAHARKGDCTTAPESPEHLYCKSLIAQAAKRAGWVVTTERIGNCPAGESWIADVFCERASAKIAFEVQMSPQAAEETIRRQRRYKSSGVRGAWFFGFKTRANPEEFDKATPVFKLAEVKLGELPLVEPFTVDLPAFVEAMLGRRLAWTVPEYDQPLQVEYLQDICWACKKTVKQVYGYLNRLEDAEGEWHERAFTVASLSTALAAVAAVITNDELAARGLNRIERRDIIRGKATQWPYANACIHCRAPQSNYHVGEKLRTELYGLADGPVAGSGDHVEERVALTGYVPIPRRCHAAGRWELLPAQAEAETDVRAER